MAAKNAPEHLNVNFFLDSHHFISPAPALLTGLVLN